MLDRLEIGDLAERHIRELSGGQQQRVFVARALLRRPDLQPYEFEFFRNGPLRPARSSA